MTSLQEIQQSIAPELARLNQLISDRLSTDNALMNEVITTYLRNKGKQIRPIVVILTAKMLGEVNDNTLAAAAAAELLHNASLIHDDVVDNSKLRRNAPTINAIWDNHIAVLVGDFFVSTAMQQAISTQDVRIIESLCYLGRQLSVGELDQIYTARFHKLTEENYLRIISYKTASLFVACAKMGLYSVKSDEARIADISRFAELLGRCFQIRDDIFDYYEGDKVGKPTGNDLKEGKITLPLLHVLLDDTIPSHDEMLSLSQREELTDDDIMTLTRYAIDNGGIDYAYHKMHQMRDEAYGILMTFPETESRAALISVLDTIITRDH